MLQMRLSGTGGQGLILAGIILAEAAILDGKKTIQSQSYGPEARGGSSKSEVLISSEPIHFPKVTNPDLVLAMSQESCKKYTGDLAADKILIIDTMLVKEVPAQVKNVYRLPITEKAKTEIGKSLFANIVALGAIVAITKCVSKESIIAAVLNRVPKGTEEVNTRALEIGMAMIQK